LPTAVAANQPPIITPRRRTGATFDTSAFAMVPGSIYDWNGDLPEQDFPKNGKYERTQSQNGLYLATRLHATDDLSIILGSRLSTFKYNEDYSYYPGAGLDDTHASYKEHGVVTPYAGVVYDLNDTYSVYGSYTKIYQPQINKDINGSTLAPVEGDSYETGLKAAYFDGKLNASLAFFRIEQDNVAQSVGTDLNTGDGIFKATDGATTNGVELELAGELAQDWNVSAGYTYARTRDKDEQRIFGFPLATSKPEHVIRTFTTYRLPGALDQLRAILGADAKILLGFDRGGSYPKVFTACRDAGADWLTWRRGALAERTQAIERLVDAALAP